MQGDASSSNFAPGRKWWLVKSDQQTFKQEFPNVVTITEQLGMTGEEFFDKEFGFGEHAGSSLDDHLLNNS